MHHRCTTRGSNQARCDAHTRFPLCIRHIRGHRRAARVSAHLAITAMLPTALGPKPAPHRLFPRRGVPSSGRSTWRPMRPLTRQPEAEASPWPCLHHAFHLLRALRGARSRHPTAAPSLHVQPAAARSVRAAPAWEARRRASSCEPPFDRDLEVSLRLRNSKLPPSPEHLATGSHARRYALERTHTSTCLSVATLPRLPFEKGGVPARRALPTTEFRFSPVREDRLRTLIGSKDLAFAHRNVAPARPVDSSGSRRRLLSGLPRPSGVRTAP
jgi:hypothetical protein